MDEVRAGRRSARGVRLLADRASPLLEVAAHLQLSVGDIAQLAAVQAPTVSRWRKQAVHPFPEPITGGRSPLFSATEVLAWLRTHHHLPEDAPSPRWHWEHVVRLLPAATPPDERSHLRAYVAALVGVGAAVHGFFGAGSQPKRPNGHLATSAGVLAKTGHLVEHEHAQLRGLLVPSLEQVRPAPEILTALSVSLDEALLQARSTNGDQAGPVSLLDAALDELAGLSPSPGASNPVLVELMTSIASRWPGTRVLDPACGEAAVLTRLSDRDPRPLALTGIDNDPELTRIARIRLALRATEADVRTADAFAPDAVAPGSHDTVLVDPPGNAGKRAISRWLGLALAAISPAGRAAVIVPASSLRANAGGDAILRRGHLAAVVLLPAKVRIGVRDTQALALLTPSQHDRVLVVELAGRVNASTPVPDAPIATLVNAWLDDPQLSADAVSALADPRLRVSLLSNHEAQVAGVLNATVPEAPPAVAAAVLDLQDLLQRHPELDGGAKLRHALQAFARANHLPVNE